MHGSFYYFTTNTLKPKMKDSTQLDLNIKFIIICIYTFVFVLYIYMFVFVCNFVLLKLPMTTKLDRTRAG